MKASYTPAEFSAQFNKEKTWTYRLLYAKKIVGIYDYGHLRIPASELEKITSSSRPHSQRRAAAAVLEVPQASHKQKPARALWSIWVKKRSHGREKLKGMRVIFRAA